MFTCLWKIFIFFIKWIQNLCRSLGHVDALRTMSGAPRQFLGIDASTPVVATPRDPCIYEYQGALRQSSDDGASVSAPQGATKISPEEYMNVVDALKPDLAVALSDEVAADVKTIRASASVDRSIAWLDRCLASPSAINQPLLGCVQGAQYLSQRKRCIEALSSRMAMLGGICVSGLGTGESPQQRTEILTEVLDQVPEEKIRMVSCIFNPLDMLEAIQLGVDLFDMSYIASITAGGYALTFPIHPTEESKQSTLHSSSRKNEANNDSDDSIQRREARSIEGQDDMKINLWSAIYKHDDRSLTHSCACAASKHTRAYIHHLLNSHEMTAYVLLESHNTEHMLKFFAAIRESIASGNLSEYVAWFKERKKRWIFGEE